jgi:hypothetical protein
MNNNIRPHYIAVLEHQKKQRDEKHAQIAKLSAELKEHHNTIASIACFLYGENSVIAVAATKVARPPKYANVSVRWAILDLLCSSPPLTPLEITEVLKREGAAVTSKAAHFSNNVSAVLSSSMKRNGEVQKVNHKWELTKQGHRTYRESLRVHTK